MIRFSGSVAKDGKFWLAEIPALDVMTQGCTRKEAVSMVADAVEGYLDKGSKVDAFADRHGNLEVGSKDVRGLVALFLRRRRLASGLTLEEVARRLGVRSHNAYARYEQGRSVPTIEKLSQLLSAVDCDTGFVIGFSEMKSGDR